MKPILISHTKFVILFTAALFFLAGGAPAQGNNQQSEGFTEIRDLISSGKYVFDARRMLPQSGNSKMLTTQYTLTVTDSTARAYLPYYGVGYSNISYGGDIGVDFDGVMEEYSKEIDEKKEKILIKFNIHGNNTLYQCSLHVTSSGSASLHVIPDNRQSISYWGDVRKADTD
jgi:hypothetical protein